MCVCVCVCVCGWVCDVTYHSGSHSDEKEK